MRQKKDDILALIGTIIAHLVLLIALYFAVIRTVVPDEDSGVLVNFGNVSASTGLFEPQYSASVPQREVRPQTTQPPKVAAEKPLITQNTEKTVAVPEKKEVKPETVAVDENAKRIQEENERRLREEEERKRIEEEQKRQQEAISNRVSNAFGMGGGTQSENQGDAATGTGNQGSPFGNTNTGANEGIGGFGTFELGGRSIGSGGLPRPTYDSQEEGRIVIEITVDPAGNVILAEIGRGTNIDNATMRRSAIDAAKKAKFNKIQGTNNQRGTITYNYKLL
jgi:TonB family C-terminal domain